MFEEIREIFGSARRSIPFEEDFDRDVDIGARLVPFAGNLLFDSLTDIILFFTKFNHQGASDSKG